MGPKSFSASLAKVGSQIPSQTDDNLRSGQFWEGLVRGSKGPILGSGGSKNGSREHPRGRFSDLGVPGRGPEGLGEVQNGSKSGQFLGGSERAWEAQMTLCWADSAIWGVQDASNLRSILGPKWVQNDLREALFVRNLISFWVRF